MILTKITKISQDILSDFLSTVSYRIRIVVIRRLEDLMMTNQQGFACRCQEQSNS